MQPVLRSLDTSLLSFARWQSVDDNPRWFVDGTKDFRADAESLRLTKAYVAMKGISASLRICRAGLVLVSELMISVSHIYYIYVGHSDKSCLGLHGRW